MLPGNPELGNDIICSYILSNGQEAVKDKNYERNEDVCRNEIKPISGNGPLLAEFKCPSE